MSTQKAKFELFNRLQSLGFTYEEAVQLRRIEMTLRRWAEAECNGEIERNEETGKPERVSAAYINGLTDKRRSWPCADKEAGALKRLKAIVDSRNLRESPTEFMQANAQDRVYAYHQTDPRGCSLYLLTRSQLPDTTDEQMKRHSGEWPLKSEETRLQWKLSCYYTRGLAVCC